MTTNLPDARRLVRIATRLDFVDGLGIAVGQRHVALAHLVKRLAKVTLAHSTVATLPPSEEGEARRMALAQTVSGFIAANEIGADRCFVSLPRSAALLSRLSLPAAARADVRNVVEFEMDRLLPVSRDDVWWDFLVREAGDKLDVLVVAALRRIVAEHLSALEQAGVRPRSVTITPVALLDLFAFASGVEGSPAVALIDDAGTLELDVVAGDSLRASHLLRPAEVASAGAVDALVRDETRGIAGGDTPLYAWRAGADAASLLGGAAGTIPEEILSSGPDLVRRLEGRLGAPDGFYATPDPTLAPAIGAALGAVREERAGLNLLPPEERRALEAGAPVVTFFLAALLILATVGWLLSAIVKDHRIAGTLHEQLDELAPQVRKVHADEQSGKEVRDRLKLLTQGDQRRISLLLRELTEIMPENAYLSTFRLRNDRVELEGFAQSASDLVPLLEKSRQFRNVQFTSPVTKVQNNQERFSLNAELEG